MPAVALTDHGSLAGAVELYRHGRKAGVKPVIGCEVYVADDRKALAKGYAHLTLLAESNEGYANLIRLASAGYLEGYYYKPRVDWELLAPTAGIVALSGCLSGRVCQGARAGPRAGRGELARLVEMFGRDSVYVELQDAGLPIQQEINPRLVALAAARASRSSPPATSTTCATRTRRRTRRCSASSRATRSQTRALAFETDQFYFKTPDEMQPLFGEQPDALASTLEIAERCTVDARARRGSCCRRSRRRTGERLRVPRRAVRGGPRRRYEQVTPSSRSASRSS